MYRLRLFGGVALEGPSGPLSGPALQKRRLALLAMLAAARGTGCSRDKLMAYLWPEHDEASARHRLADSLYVLRKALGDEAVPASGEYLRLDADIVRTDTSAFAAALQQGDLETAVDLYAGPFMDGFYLSGAAEFEDWVESERRRLANQYEEALESLAEAAEEAEDHTRAAGWWRRLTAHDPYNSRIVLRLVTALARAGDPANAIQEAREHERLLHEELGVETPADLRRVIEQLMQESLPPTSGSALAEADAVEAAEFSGAQHADRPEREWRSAVASSVVALAYVVAAWAALQALALLGDEFGLPDWALPVAVVLLLIGLPVVMVASLAKEDRRLRLFTWRSAGLALVAAVALWGVVVSGWVLFGERDGPREVEVASFDPANRIAVLPFSYRGTEEFAYLGEGMVDLLSATLEGAGELRSVDSWAVLGMWAQEDGRGPRVERARVVASGLGAGRYLLGEVVEVSGRLRITARIYDTGASDYAVQASVEGGPGELYELADDLTAQLVVGLQSGPAGRLVHVAELTTDSLEALKVYLKGQIELRAGRLTDAAAMFQEAIEIDSSFALAYYGLSVASSWGLGPFEAAEKAVQHSGRLPWREQRIVEANHALLLGAAGESERTYREVLTKYPNDVEALSGLGAVLELYNPLNGRSVVEARQPLQRALLYEPDSWVNLWTLARMEASEGNWPEVDSLVRRAYADRPVAFGFRAILAFAGEDLAAREQVLADADEVSTGSLVDAAKYVGTMVQDLRGALELTRLLARPARAPAVQAYAHLLAAQLELGLGRRRAAEIELSRAAALHPASALEHEALWSLASFLPTDRSRLEGLRDSLVRWEADAVVPASTLPGWSFALKQHEGVHPHLRLYLLGCLNARLGAHEAALRYAAELDSMAAPPIARTLSHDLAQAIRARVHRNRLDLEEALEALEAAPREVHIDRRQYSPFFTEPQERYLRAGLLAQLERYEEALRWYETLGKVASGQMYVAPAHLRRAEIYERLGEREKAVHHYARFIELWQDADPELQPQVDEARRAVEALSSDR